MIQLQVSLPLKSLLSRERETVKHWIIIVQGLLESDVKISLGTNG